MFNGMDNMSGVARIKVIGVGGAGNNADNRMIEAGIQSASYVAVNTDKQILLLSKAEVKIPIGSALTKGLGAGADPEVGRAAAEESKETLTEAVKDTDLLFITAGMGGGTGTGAAPVIAKIARDLKILTIAVVTEPFNFEGKKRMDNTVKGLENLKKYVDTLVIIPNDKIMCVVPKNTPMVEALRVADEILKQGIRGIADLIVNPAVRLAVNCPLLETTIEGAKGVILNIVGGNDLTMDEVQTAATLVQSVVDYSANIIFGACIDSNINDEVEVTVIATGFPHVENMYNMKDERNQASKNFFVNRGLPENEAQVQETAQTAAPSYVRTPINNTFRGQQPDVYRQPYQQQAAQPQQFARQPQPVQAQPAPQYVQPQQPNAYAQPQQFARQPQPAPVQQPVTYAQPQQGYAPQPQPTYAPQGNPEPAIDRGGDNKDLPTFVQRLFKKK